MSMQFNLQGPKFRVQKLSCRNIVFLLLSLAWLITEHAFIDALSTLPLLARDLRNGAHDSKLYAEKVSEENSSDISQSQLKYIMFSRAFQRHVVYKKKAGSTYRDFQRDKCIESFMFLDEAMEAHPDAAFELLSDIGVENDGDDYQLVIAGMGTIPSSQMLAARKDKKDFTDQARKTLCYLAAIAMAGERGHVLPPGSAQLKQKRDLFVHKLGCDIAPKRFESHSPETIHYNYIQIIDLLTRGRRKIARNGKGEKVDCLLFDWTQSGLSFSEADARAVVSAFPQICLYDIHEVEERIKFLIFPQAKTASGERKGHVGEKRTKKDSEVDYYEMMRQGRGAGLTIKQATEAVRAVPQLLSLYHEDSRKRSMVNLYKELNVPSTAIETTRSELANSINGCDISDFLSFAYMHSIGVSWEQMKLLLDAIPLLTYAESEPGWELLDNGPIRNSLDTPMLNFLRKRLQISNSDLYAMIKTHSRLTTYSVASNLLPTMNTLQSKLMLSTRELRRIILRMPSVTGMSVSNDNGKESSLEQKIAFFTDEVQLCPLQLKKSIVKQPSLLQYSIESTMRPKLHFLISDLRVDKSDVSRIICAAPAVFGLSLEDNLRPKIAMLRERCNLTNGQISELIVTVPLILLLSLKQKIEVTLNFLTIELDLSPHALGLLIQTCPRILLHGVETSLFPKINMLRDALEREGHATKNANDLAIEIIIANPSLLVTSNAIFQSRITKCQKQGKGALSIALKPRNVARKKLLESQSATEKVQEASPKRSRKRRIVIEMIEGRITNEYLSVKDAAAHLDVSTSSIYTACSKGKEIKGKTLRYRDLPQAGHNAAPMQEYSFDDIKSSPFTLFDQDSDSVLLVAFASGSIYPRDNIDTVRGIRKAGGIAIHIPQITKIAEGSYTKFQEATKMSFGMIMPEGESGSDPKKGLVLAGFPFLRPSRNRCDLYACHGALKVMLQLLKEAAEERDMRKTNVDIVIYTDSTYAWKLLKDSDNLLEWGSASSREEVVYEINGPLSLANPDLLFPLTKTMHRMSNNAVINRSRNKRLCVGQSMTISFRYIGELRYDRGYAKESQELQSFARKAAMWQFDKG